MLLQISSLLYQQQLLQRGSKFPTFKHKHTHRYHNRQYSILIIVLVKPFIRICIPTKRKQTHTSGIVLKLTILAIIYSNTIRLLYIVNWKQCHQTVDLMSLNSLWCHCQPSMGIKFQIVTSILVLKSKQFLHSIKRQTRTFNRIVTFVRPLGSSGLHRYIKITNSQLVPFQLISIPILI